MDIEPAADGQRKGTVEIISGAGGIHDADPGRGNLKEGLLEGVKSTFLTMSYDQLTANHNTQFSDVFNQPTRFEQVATGIEKSRRRNEIICRRHHVLNPILPAFTIIDEFGILVHTLFEEWSQGSSLWIQRNRSSAMKQRV